MIAVFHVVASTPTSSASGSAPFTPRGLVSRSMHSFPSR